MQYNNAGAMNTNGWGGYSTHGVRLIHTEALLHRANQP